MTALNPLRQVSAAAPAVERVIVIGAGIIGSAIGYQLSKRGCQVTVLDKVGPAAQASGNSFAWINASWSDTPDSYFSLRTHSLNEYHRLSEELNLPIRWGGALEWYHDADSTSEMTDGISLIQKGGAAAKMINRGQAADIEPNLDPQSDYLLAYSPADGAIDAQAATFAMIQGMLDNGGELIAPAMVSDVATTRKRAIVSTDIGTFDADLVVVAAGTNANDIAHMAGLKTDLLMPATPGIIVKTRPVEPLLNTVCYTTNSHFHQQADGRLIVAEKLNPPETTTHLNFLANQPNVFPNSEFAMQHAKRILNTAGFYVPEIATVEPERISIGWRPLPLDGLPTIGHVADQSRIYLASMHSGITLAPIVGSLASREILEGVRINLLEKFRVERFY